MKQKLLISLAPLLAIAALAVMPAAAQAQHWYKNGAIIAPGQTVPVTGSGSLEFALSLPTTAKCVVSPYHGYVVNPVSNGPGEGAISMFKLHPCTTTYGGCASLEARIETYGLPSWPLKLVAGVAIRLEIKNMDLWAGCCILNTWPSTAPASCGWLAHFNTGVLTPKIKNGRSASVPSLLEFGLGSGSLNNGPETIAVTGPFAISIKGSSGEVITAK